MIELKRATAEDAFAIISTRQKAWDATYRGIYPDDVIDDFDWNWHLAAEQRRLNNPDFHCFLILDHQQPVGYVSYGRVSPGAWKDFTFRLHSFYLLPAYQHRGLGRKLFLLVKKACIEMGFHKMYLDCHPKNEQALGFYEHMGGIITNIDAGHENPMEDTCTIEYLF